MRRVQRNHLATVLATAVFSLVVLFGIMFFAGFWSTKSTYDVSAYVMNARGIAGDSTVFEAGLPVGLVTGIRRHGPDAILSLRITGGERPLPVDTKVQLGLRSLAGETDVLLMPGHHGVAVRNGGSLGLSQSQDYTEVDQILQEFAGPTTGDTRDFFQGLGGGLRGEGPHLNQVLGGFAALVNNSPPLTSTLAAQHGQVADIVQNLGNIMTAIGQRTQALQQFAHGARETFDTVAGRDVALKRMLGQVQYAFQGAKVITDSLTMHSRQLGPVLTSLTSAIAKLSPAVDRLTPAARNGIQIVGALNSASPALRSVLVNLTKLQPSASAALPAVHALTCQVDPMLRYLAPYGRDMGAFFENFGAADSPYSPNHELLTSALVDPTHFFRGLETQPVSAALTTLINLGIFKKFANSKLGYDPAPGPGGMGRTDVGVGDAGPVEFGLTHKFPHVTADCTK